LRHPAAGLSSFDHADSNASDRGGGSGTTAEHLILHVGVDAHDLSPVPPRWVEERIADSTPAGR